MKITGVDNDWDPRDGPKGCFKFMVGIIPKNVQPWYYAKCAKDQMLIGW